MAVYFKNPETKKLIRNSIFKGAISIVFFFVFLEIYTYAQLFHSLKSNLRLLKFALSNKNEVQIILQ